MLKSDFYYFTAVSSVIISFITLCALLLTLPKIHMEAEYERENIMQKSEQFKAKINEVWSEMKIATYFPAETILLPRRTRSPWNMICSGCIQLSCPTGPPGLGGRPGQDGSPGMSGNPGAPGDDGFDIELAPEDDLPCIICPAGPPGQRLVGLYEILFLHSYKKTIYTNKQFIFQSYFRGIQGEIGMSGEQGPQGEQGPSGITGSDGASGLPGPPGPRGFKGQAGQAGPPGDTVIAGVGVKGARGPSGPAGPKGPTGPHGKTAKRAGTPGKPGTIGPIGPVGNAGRFGEEGSWGPPGPPGIPASYCNSDCGLQKVYAPAFIDELIPQNQDEPYRYQL
ncbi:unnamed protein product [Dracunculus medinensis]|uniref:Col_cuticle_N domain-containing protein n=1 Tax=Dracunculus medinensis TaxID=318479 RepID=A0A0N4U651_DRAME|nr:unnamed protein product [Dracunculus medinensis]